MHQLYFLRGEQESFEIGRQQNQMSQLWIDSLDTGVFLWSNLTKTKIIRIHLKIIQLSSGYYFFFPIPDVIE